MLENRPRLKRFILFLISPERNPKPRLWVKLFVNSFFHKIGKGAVVRRRRSRIDVFPWHRFEVGRYSLIEDFTVVNNGAGDVVIGDESRVGIGSVLIGPVKLGNKVGLGQNVFVSGFNHGYEDGERDSNEQELVIKEVIIGEESHIGSNSVILPGVKIGKRVQIGAGSVVTQDIESFCVAVGNPAKVIKRYDSVSAKWIKC
jgi:acetyltransferase-like isoleucine patch superfamily enzyme